MLKKDSNAVKIVRLRNKKSNNFTLRI